MTAALKSITKIAIGLSILLFVAATNSCVVFYKKDNGNHKGWNKNPNNPHHPNSTNPGHNKQKGNPNK